MSAEWDAVGVTNRLILGILAGEERKPLLDAFRAQVRAAALNEGADAMAALIEDGEHDPDCLVDELRHMATRTAPAPPVPDNTTGDEGELGTILTRAQKLVDGWKQASEDHAKFAESKVMTPEMAAKQEGRSLQLLDCADELADVLKGEDPDDWEYGVGIDVIDRAVRTPEGGDR